MSTGATPLDVIEGRAQYSIVCGDCLEVVRTIPDSSVDSMVTDPPSGISFMGADWDGDKGGGEQWIAWLTERLREALRVLKPGGYVCVWSLPRTSHWTGTAIERAGFEVRDTIHHTFGSGFPKSLNVSLAIDKTDGVAAERQAVHTYSASGNAGTSTKDKGGTYSVGVENSPPVQLSVSRGATDKSREWDGFGTALKPGHEVWWIARKPFKGTLVANVLQHGCGALNIDVCRVATDWNESDRPESWRKSAHTADADADKIAAPPGDGIQCHPGGRWPANVVFTHSAECTDGECADDCPLLELFRQSGVSESSGGTLSVAPNFKNQVYGTGFGRTVSAANQHADSGSAARFFNTFEWHPELDDPFIYLAKPSTAEREAGCERLPRKSAGELVKREDGKPGPANGRSGAGGGSSGRHNHHPTLKSIALMSHLIRLVTRPGGVTLSMFLGSGTDVCAAIQSGIRAIGIELNPGFVSIAEARALYWSNNSATTRRPIQTQSEKQINLFGELQ